jgi:hypothetical protein
MAVSKKIRNILMVGLSRIFKLASRMSFERNGLGSILCASLFVQFSSLAMAQELTSPKIEIPTYVTPDNNCSVVLKKFKTEIEKLINDGLSPYQMSLKTKDTISGLECDSETADKTIRSWKEFISEIGPNGPHNIVYGLIRDDILFVLVFDKTKNKFESYYTTFFRPSDDFLKKHPQKYPGIIWIP